MPSDKIKSKDLSYESNLPPFLQRLHAQKAGLGDQDRHERPIARPKRAKGHEDEDEPTVVDESGELVSKAELEKLNAAGTDADGPQEGGNVTGELKGEDEALVSGALQSTEPSKADAKVADGTATKKRKVGKVVGEADAADDDAAASSSKKQNSGSAVKQAGKTIAKKSKPVKLAFDDADAD